LATSIAKSQGVPTSGMAKRGYHHGNLRQALVDACLKLIEAKGPTGFTLSQASREAGVTPAAVYRHFEGREDLIAEAAKLGYEIFGDLMEHAYNDGQPSALSAFEATGRAYLAFARKFPGHYVAMFESGISINRTPELNAVATKAMGVLEKAAEDLSQHIPAEKRPPPQMFSAHIWALSHGVVELFARGSPGTKSPCRSEVMLGYDLPRTYGPFQPTFGLSMTDKGDWWIGVGGKWTVDDAATGPFFFEATFLPGYYQFGDGPDLGGVLHYRASVGVGYEFDNGASLLVAYDHRSNGNIIFPNPGLETLSIRYAIPF